MSVSGLLDIGEFGEHLFRRDLSFRGVKHVCLFLVVGLFRSRKTFRSFFDPIYLGLVIICRCLKR